MLLASSAAALAALRADCNDNDIADACDLDCGTPDCDPPCGDSLDCNSNGIPDECERDCDGSGVPDDCEALTDCDANGTPDVCELPPIGSSPDCNTNNALDHCDIAGETSDDCNINAIPDECDINLGTSPDVNDNGIPDECDANPPLPAPPPHDWPKSRFISIDPNNPDTPVAIMVQMMDLACSQTGRRCLTDADR